MRYVQPLHRYLFSLSVKERVAFARRVGSNKSHLHNIAYGLKPCSAELAVAIERETGGLVPVEVTRPKVDWAYIRGSARPKQRRARVRELAA